MNFASVRALVEPKLVEDMCIPFSVSSAPLSLILFVKCWIMLVLLVL